MSRNCKLCIAVIFGFFVFGQISVFAQTPTIDDSAFCSTISICGSSSKEFTLMLEFSEELINAIKTVGTEWKYLGKYVNPNWFVGDKFTPPDMGLLKQATTSLTQKLDFLLATTAIFTSPQQWWGLKDIFAGILTLFKNKVFSRDLQRVEKLDADITQKRYELGLGWGWTKTVRAENLTIFQKIIDKYIDKWLFDTTSTISDGVTYNTITSMAGRIDTALKSFLSLNTTDQFDAFSKGAHDGFTLVFVQTSIAAMDRQYACARWPQNICDTTNANFIKNMKKIWSGAVDKIKKSISLITGAAQRLTKIFSNDDSYKAREQSLLNSYYGNKKMSKWRIQINTGAIFSQWRSMIFDDQSKTISSVDQVKTAVSTPSPLTVDQLVNTDSSQFSQRMFAGMSSFLDDQQRDLSLINFAEVKDFSSYFNLLGQRIATIRTDIFGTKDTDNFVKTLTTACEMQAGWLWTKCRSN